MPGLPVRGDTYGDAILLTEDMSKSSFSLKSHFQIKGILKQKL